MSAPALHNRPPTEPGWYWCGNYRGEETGPELWLAVVRVDADANGQLFANWLTAPGQADWMMIANGSPLAVWSDRLEEPDLDAHLPPLKK